jgi:hypothetical protein
MRTASFIRLHTFNDNPVVVFDSIAELSDKLFFLANGVEDRSIIEAAARHPKCAEIREDNKRWNNHESLIECYKWADEIKPQFVMTFDEDEMLPPKLDEIWSEWEKTDSKAMLFKCLWCWENIDTVLKDYHKSFGWHMKLCKYFEGMWKDGMTHMNSLNSCIKGSFPFPYPYRHLPIMTQKLRDIRKYRKDRASFWDKPLKTIPYDPKMTYKEWVAQSENLAKGPY